MYPQQIQHWNVTVVTVLIRSDDCCANINGLQIYLDTTLCATLAIDLSSSQGQWVRVLCAIKGIASKSIKLVLPVEDQSLSFCGVGVYGIRNKKDGIVSNPPGKIIDLDIDTDKRVYVINEFNKAYKLELDGSYNLILKDV